MFGMAGVGLVTMLILGTTLTTWKSGDPPQAAPAITIFDVVPPEAPEPERAARPEPDKARQEQPPPRDRRAIEPPEIELPSLNPIPLPAPWPAPDPAPPIGSGPPPEPRPAPPAPQASAAKPTWQGAVLAALNRKKRYPREASLRRQQGTPWIAFTMDREGRVLSVRLERSSGFRVLDDEAVKLPRRAQPLPKPPDEVNGATIELVVPVEFFMR